MLVVGGYNTGNGFVTKTEVIDLVDPMNVCQPWADHPTGTALAAGAFINNALHICGGYTPDKVTSDDCHLIGPTSAESSTSLRTGSTDSGGINYQGSLLFTGGWSKYY